MWKIIVLITLAILFIQKLTFDISLDIVDWHLVIHYTHPIKKTRKSITL
jgi:hypothetical protein